MKVLPKSIVERRELNLRQGIKSSLSSIRSVIALVYTLYRSNNRKAVVEYSESTNGGQIKLHSTLENSIKTFLGIDDLTSMNDNPLFKSQMEALQVGIELIFKLGKVEFIDSTLASSAERTGGNRYNKRIRFGTNIQIVDTFLSSYEADLGIFLTKWLLNQESEKREIDEGVKRLLTIFSEETQFKIRYNNQEISFQQDGIYKEFVNGNTVVGRDEHENVGPFRVFKSYVKEGLHPYISENGDEFTAKNTTTDALEYYQIVSNALDLIPRRTQITSFVPSNPELEDNTIVETSNSAEARQIIYYGAPGTGKSHKIKEMLAGVSKENIFRTTFHPDSDYSTFVGSYKPSTDKPEEKLYNKEELISKLTELKEQGVTYAPQKFGAQYWYSLKQLTLQDKKDILAACEMSDNYTVEFDKGIAVGEELLKKSKESRIIYKFIPQAFLLAYMRAYSTTDKVYLIIEEINRGNCAQIFGDLFQLLDRDEEGVSEYRIKADADLRAYLEEELGADSDAIKDGELCLPSNLYIYATMNTSDQSLFPIDSAFKRRWDWEYEPIKYKNTNWVIDINGNKFSWVSFQREINERIFDATSSEDKMLGDYFVNPADGIVTEKILLNKILFYLWNDVCKEGEGDIFKVSETEDVTFSELHGKGGSEKLVAMMKYLGVSSVNNTAEDDLNEEPIDQESKTWYQNLWADVRNNLSNKGLENVPVPRERQTYQLGVGLTGISVLANVPRTKANGYVGYYIEKQQASDIYPKLLTLKNAIEDKLGELDWHREGDRYAVVKRRLDLNGINDDSLRIGIVENLSTLLVDFKETILPLIDQLR